MLGKSLFLLWMLLSLPWLELWRAKGGPPPSQRLWRQESEALAGPGDSWPLSGCCREAGACPDIHSVRAEQSKGSSTLVFFPTCRVLPLRALEWELQRPKCELKCMFFWKVLILFFWKSIECSHCGIYGASGQPSGWSWGKLILLITCVRVSVENFVSLDRHVWPQPIIL